MNTGIYFLIYRKKVVYVGATTRYPNRIKQHPTKKFTSHRFIKCEEKDLAKYERRWIKLFRPKYNLQEGAIKIRKAHIPDSEKTVLVGFYTKQTVIDKFGGMYEIRMQAKNHVESLAREA